MAYPAIPSAPTEQPPSYEEAQQIGDLPPSYDELFGEFRRVDSPSGLAKFVYKAINFIANTVAAAVVLALLNIIPIAMIVVGTINKDRCPVNHNIPTWLIVSGACSLTRSAIKLAYRTKDRQNLPRPLLVKLFESILSIFLFIWFIIGSIWVYWAYGKVTYETSSQNFCDQTTFVLSFVFITATYVLVALSCFLVCCCCCCVCFQKREGDIHQPIPNA